MLKGCKNHLISIKYEKKSHIFAENSFISISLQTILIINFILRL